MGKAVRCLGGTCAAALLLAAGAAGGGYLVHSWYTTRQTVDRISRWIPGLQTVGEAASRALGIGEAGLDLFLSKEGEFPPDAPLPPRVSAKHFHIPRRAERPAMAVIESPLGPEEAAAYYEKALAEKGWKTGRPGVKGDTDALVTATKDGRVLSAWISPRREGGSFVMLNVGRIEERGKG